MIKRCSCVNYGQDRIHGNGMRVVNPLSKKPGSKQQYRCTVCGATKE